jgi:signal transduction histidine kinase
MVGEDSRLRVLLVEDSADDALLLERELRRAGFAPETHRVETADEMARSLAEPGWDIVISDYRLPTFSGMAALGLLQGGGLDLPFIMVSGKIGEELAVEAMRAGANDCVMKDNLARLGPAVRRELEQAEERRARRRAEEVVVQSRGELQKLAARVVSAQEDERGRISRELHDEIGQSLTGIILNLEAVEAGLPDSCPREITSRLADTRELARGTLEQIRGLSFLLRPAMLDDFGLIPTLRTFGKRFAARADLEVRLEVAGLEDERLGSEVETVLYRAIQEALTNIARHAHARAVTITLERDPAHQLTVTVQDDGCGFDPGARGNEHGIGLLGVRERLALIGGSLAVDSSPGGGTRLRITVPS